MSYDEAESRVLSGDPKQVDEIDEQFAIMVSEGKTVRMASSIGQPLRYFLAKLVDGPCLLVAERMDEIVARLKEMGIADQFHPSYTRMVPAHHVVQIQLVGCPDPNPKYERFFTPVRNNLPPDIAVIGQTYIAPFGTRVRSLARYTFAQGADRCVIFRWHRFGCRACHFG